MGSPQEIIRQSIVRSTKVMDRQNAAPIIRSALSDDSHEVIQLAEKEIDARWPDGAWI
jgi:hypothetical protein